MTRIASSVDEVVALYETYGTDPYDEEVSQLDHALQCAALARRDGHHDSLVVAALLHDVGHLLELEAGHVFSPLARDLGHEQRGAVYLSEVFPLSVTAPIALHVVAKRYFAATEPGFIDRLSEGSKASFVRQGGPLGASEVGDFVVHEAFAPACALRRYDDAGKVVGLRRPLLEDYRTALDALAHENTAG